MNAFAAAMDVLFEDQNMAIDATYMAGGVGTQLAVRVIRKAPDQLAQFSSGRFVVDSIFLDVRVAEVASPTTGDFVEIDGETYIVISAPTRDRERLVWTLEAKLAV